MNSAFVLVHPQLPLVARAAGRGVAAVEQPAVAVEQEVAVDNRMLPDQLLLGIVHKDRSCRVGLVGLLVVVHQDKVDNRCSWLGEVHHKVEGSCHDHLVEHLHSKQSRDLLMTPTHWGC